MKSYYLTNSIEFGDFNNLICPRCGDSFLHRGQNTGNRLCDRWEVCCEGCGDGLDLEMVDEKGNIRLFWLFDPNRVPRRYENKGLIFESDPD